MQFKEWRLIKVGCHSLQNVKELFLSGSEVSFNKHTSKYNAIITSRGFGVGMAESDVRLRKLESRVALLASIADCEKFPFICACLEADMDSSQVDGVLALVTKAENLHFEKNPMSYAEFEKELQLIVPSRKGNSEFTKSIIRALNKENKFILPSQGWQRHLR